MEYKELDVWLNSRKLVKMIYEDTKIFPESEKYGLTNQIRRCAVSIPSNIAEGCGKQHRKDQSSFFIFQEGQFMN